MTIKRMIVSVFALAFIFAPIYAEDKDNASLPPPLQKRMDSYNAAIAKENQKLIADLKSMKADAEKSKNQSLADAVKDKLDEINLDNIGNSLGEQDWKQISIPAKSGGRGVKLGNFKKGQKISIAYVKGTWTGNANERRLFNPDAPEKGDDWNWLHVGVWSNPKGDLFDKLADVPKGTSTTPFEYEFASDSKNVSLIPTTPGGDFRNWGISPKGADGAVVYKIKIEK